MIPETEVPLPVEEVKVIPTNQTEQNKSANVKLQIKELYTPLLRFYLKNGKPRYEAINLSIAQIAKKLNTTEKTVKTHVNRL